MFLIMTTLEKINNLTWHNAINKLKDILKAFISQADVMMPYKIYRATITQSGTNAPIAVVLENTLGNVTWAYDSEGFYTANTNGLFAINRTIVDLVGFGMVSGNYIDDTDVVGQTGKRQLRNVIFYIDDPNQTSQLFLETSYIYTDSTVGLSTLNKDSVLDKPITVEIRVYNE